MQIYILVEETFDERERMDYCFNCYDTHQAALDMMFSLSMNYGLSGFEIDMLSHHSMKVTHKDSSLCRYFHIIESNVHSSLIKTP